MKRRWVFWLKLLVLLAVVGWLGYQFYKAWKGLHENPAGAQQITIDWRWGALAVAGFCGSMITGSLVWRWLAGRMGDRSPVPRLLGAYTFSQMGKYVPGKVALLLMRIERTGRFGMSPEICTLSTLLENALYMVSGGLTGMVAMVKVGQALNEQYPDKGYSHLVWPVTIGAVALLAAVCAPPVFYRLVNRLLQKARRPAVERSQWLGAPVLILAVLAFIPCWLFGALALWASTQTVHAVPIGECWWFVGAFALSVIIGMASLLPGGTGIREAVLVAAVTMQLVPDMGRGRAFVLAGIVAVLQRLFQLGAEVLLGLLGMAITRRPGGSGNHAESTPAARSSNQGG